MASQEQVSLILKVVDQSSRELDSIKRKIDGFEKSIGSADEVVNGLTKRVGGLIAAYIGLDQAIGQGKAILDVSLQLEAIDTRLKFVTGSAASAAQEFEFISNEADRLNQNILTLGQGFSKFAAGAKSTLSLEETRQVFLGLIEAGTVFKLTTEQIDGALLALTQIASKGTVQAEELRGQLAERIPGAFSIAARAINVTEQELGKMLERGEVLAKDFLPAFGAELRKTFGDDAVQAAESGVGKINEFNNAVIGLRSTLANVFAQPASSITVFFTEVIKTLDLATQQAGLVIDKISNDIGLFAVSSELAFKKFAKDTLGIFSVAVGVTSEDIRELEDAKDRYSKIADEIASETQRINDIFFNSGKTFEKTKLPFEEGVAFDFGGKSLDESLGEFFEETKFKQAFQKALTLDDADIKKISEQLGKEYADGFKNAFEKELRTLTVAIPNTFQASIIKNFNDGKISIALAESLIAGAEQFDGALKTGVEGALSSGINDALNGDFEFSSFANLMRQAVIGAVAQGVAAGALAGLGTGGLLAVGAGAAALGGLFGGGSSGKSEAEKQLERQTALLDKIENNTNKLNEFGLTGSAIVDTLRGLSASNVDLLSGGVKIGGSFTSKDNTQSLQDILGAEGLISSLGGVQAAKDEAKRLRELEADTNVPGLTNPNLRKAANIEEALAIVSGSLNELSESGEAFVSAGGTALTQLRETINGIADVSGNAELKLNNAKNALIGANIGFDGTEKSFDDLQAKFIGFDATVARLETELKGAVDSGDEFKQLEITAEIEKFTSENQALFEGVLNNIDAFELLSDTFNDSANSVEGMINTVSSLGDITRSQQSFIDTNLGLIETGADSVSRLQDRFAEEAAQAEQFRQSLGTDATAEQLAQLRKEEQDVLSIGQTLIDKASEVFASSASRDTIVADVIATVDKNQGDLLSLQEQLLNTNNDLLTDIRDAIFAQNVILKQEVSLI